MDRLYRGSPSARQQAALIGPVERQIELGKTRHSEYGRLPALQDRLDQLGAEKDRLAARVFEQMGVSVDLTADNRAQPRP